MPADEAKIPTLRSQSGSCKALQAIANGRQRTCEWKLS